MVRHLKEPRHISHQLGLGLLWSVGGPRRSSGLIIRKSEVEDGSWERMGLFVVPGALQHGAEVDPMTCFNELEETTVRLV
jgi:hypothetical protein